MSACNNAEIFVSFPCYERVLDEALLRCESEPIHIPGTIQPHGVLLGIDPTTFVVNLATENVHEQLGRPAGDVLGPDIFLASMCHAIRTPMNGAIGLTELLLATRLDEIQHRYASTIRASGDALLTVISEILDMSKIEARKFTLTPTDFDLTEILRKLTELLGTSATQKGVRLAGDFSGDFPRELHGDAIQIRQILTNLAANAVNFTDKGEVTISGDLIRSTSIDATIGITVKDTGIGIPGSKQGTIFESFVQGESGTRRASGGTGLGLSICRSLADLMGAQLEFASEEGRGSAFWLQLTLPLTPGYPPRPIAARGANMPEILRPIRPLRILLVEDNATNQLVAREMIVQQGHEVEEVSNGLESIEALARRSFELVLMDVQMPVMDGYAAVTEIRRREAAGGARTPIVAVTANATEDERRRCLEVGMDDYLAKPITTASLARMLERFGKASGSEAPQPSQADLRPDDLLEMLMGRGDIARNVLDMARETCPEILRKLEECLRASEGEAAAKQCHRLRGAALSITADRLAAACLDLEQIIRSGEQEAATRRYQDLLVDWTRLTTAIASFEKSGRIG